MYQTATVTFVTDILDCMFWVARRGSSWRVGRVQHGRGFRNWGVLGLPVGWLRLWRVVLIWVFGVGWVFSGLPGVCRGLRLVAFLGDFGGTCLTLDIHVSDGWQWEPRWELGSMPSGSGPAHWWLGDILCFGIPFLLCVRALAGVNFSWVTQFKSFPPCIVGLR